MAEASKQHVYWVLLQSGFGDKSIAFSFAFETVIASVEALRQELLANGIVAGNKLRLTPDGRGGRLVVGRTGFAFGLSGMVSAQDYVVPVWEPEE